MAKKVIKMVKLQVPAGKANPAPPIGPHLVKQVLTSWRSVKSSTHVRRSSGIDHSGCNYGIRGPFFYVRNENAAGCCIAARCSWNRKRFRRTEQEESRNG